MAPDPQGRGAGEYDQRRRRARELRQGTRHILQKADLGVRAFAPDQAGVVLLEKAVAQPSAELLRIHIPALEQPTDQASFVDRVVMGLGALFFEDDLGHHTHVAVDELRDGPRRDLQELLEHPGILRQVEGHLHP